MKIGKKVKLLYNHLVILTVGAWRSLASAPAWGAGGRMFESSRPDHFPGSGSVW